MSVSQKWYTAQIMLIDVNNHACQYREDRQANPAGTKNAELVTTTREATSRWESKMRSSADAPCSPRPGTVGSPREPRSGACSYILRGGSEERETPMWRT